MPDKTCFKCGVEKPLTEFHKHPQMKDGRVNKCKICNNKDVRENRAVNVEYYREYDRARGNRQTDEARKKYALAYPIANKARNMVSNAVRDKRLFREPCEVCNTEISVHAHHDDYSKPLNVRWLCAVHHFEWHSENGEGLNKV
tara:strand:- start:45 stop:473 length:429 start_codon:yes stop_codon:yes gene_type:complete